MPVIFICEDNGIGISTRTPTNWIKANFEHKPGIKYISCNGLDILSTVDAAMKADHHARVLRKPVFLHMKTVRLMGHAGSDVEQSYQTKQQITQNESQDPLLYSAALITEKDILTHNEIRSWYLHTEERIRRIAEEAIARPKLTSTSEVLQSLWPTSTSNGQLTSKRSAKSKTLKEANTDKALPMAKHINTALADIMAEHPNTVILGEDVGQKGGVYGVTQGLHEQFGPSRITNTVLDEQSILGAAIGLAQCGYLPIAEIQYLAYVHNAEDQIRGEAASLSFFSEAQFTNPMVVRIAGFAYQKGFGGHFHNDNSFAVFRDIPGIIVVTPSNGPDAASILRSCIAMAIEEHKVLIIIEPIALYSTRDLHKDGDGLWAAEYKRARDQNTIRWGDIKTIGNGKDLCILSYANGFYLSNKAEKILREQHNLRVRLVDIRWLHPLPEKQISDVTADYEHILIVDECRRSGSVSEALFTLFAESGRHCKIARVNAEDSFVPLGQAANLVLPSVDEIVDNALQLINSHTGTSVLDLRKNSND